MRSLLVLRQVGVEQVGRATADVDAPRLELHLADAHLDGADERLAVLVEHGLDGEVLRLELGVVIDLPVVLIDRLLEVAFAIEQADADEAEPEIARGFRMIAGEDAETAGRDGQGFVEAEFRSEIDDRVL